MGLVDFFRRRPRRRIGDQVLTAEMRVQILGLEAEGVPIADIADDLGISESSVRRVLKGRGREEDPQRQIRAIVADAQADALRTSPELRQRIAEAAIEQLVGGAKHKPLDQAQLMEAKGFFASQQLELVHRSEIDGWRKREESLLRQLEKKDDRIDDLRDRLARFSGEDEQPGFLERMGLAPDAQKALVEQLGPVISGGMRTLLPGMPPALTDGQAPQAAALPSASVGTPGAFLAAYVALEPVHAAQLVSGKANEGLAFDRVPLYSLAMLLAADPHRPEQVVQALCGLPDGELLRQALERQQWPTWLPAFIAALVNWPESDAPVASDSPNGVSLEHSNGSAAEAVAHRGGSVTPDLVVAQLDSLEPEQFVSWALTVPDLLEQVGRLKETDDRQIPSLLKMAAQFGDEPWCPVATWLLDHPAKRRAIVADLRQRLDDRQSATVASSSIGELAPEDDAGA